jgi:hypothetical protein
MPLTPEGYVQQFAAKHEINEFSSGAILTYQQVRALADVFQSRILYSRGEELVSHEAVWLNGLVTSSTAILTDMFDRSGTRLDEPELTTLWFASRSLASKVDMSVDGPPVSPTTQELSVAMDMLLESHEKLDVRQYSLRRPMEDYAMAALDAFGKIVKKMPDRTLIADDMMANSIRELVVGFEKAEIERSKLS